MYRLVERLNVLQCECGEIIAVTDEELVDLIYAGEVDVEIEED
jgi:hypothetical protein